MKFYGCLTMIGLIGTPLVVLGWHGIGAAKILVDTASGVRADLASAIVYLAVAALHLVRGAEGSRDHRASGMAAVYVVLALTILFGTGGVYGLLASLSALFPGIPDFNILSATLLATSILLLATMFFHRRTHD